MIAMLRALFIAILISELVSIFDHILKRKSVNTSYYVTSIFKWASQGSFHTMSHFIGSISFLYCAYSKPVYGALFRSQIYLAQLESPATPVVVKLDKKLNFHSR
ncbi:hypothetical protein V8C35DRAFT_73701 [Trichoderma chlorosporum]